MANLYPSNVIKVCKILPPCQSVLIRGPHGSGKSQIVAHVGIELDVPLIDLRLSQMTEGDFLGLPKMIEPEYDDAGKLVRHGMTEFQPPWWFVKAMNEPCVLLLDEINRAVPEVMQCAFQLVLDRAIQGKEVHPETRIIAAINATHHYQVNDMDPALLDRFLVIDMVPVLKDWKAWAEDRGIDSSIVEFCVQHKDHWWYDPTSGGGLEPGKVYPTPRAWEMLHQCFEAADLFEQFRRPEFRHIAQGLVGLEAGEAYWNFIKEYERNITAEQVLNDYDAIKKRIKQGISAEQIMAISDKLVNHCLDNTWTKNQTRNLGRFMSDMSNEELVFALWNRINGLAKTSKLAAANGILTHRHCKEIIFKVVAQGVNAD